MLEQVRRRLGGVLDVENALMLGLIALYLPLCIHGGLATGLSWDENDHRNYGIQVLAWYGSPDRHAFDASPLMRTYGAFFDVVSLLAGKVLSSASPISIRHACTAIFSAVGLLYCGRTARELSGRWAGPIAVIILIALPRWTGDSMFNPVDIPFGSLHAAALFYLVRIARTLPATQFSLWAKFGVATGLAIGVRSGGLLPIIYAFALLTTHAALAYSSSTPGPFVDRARAAVGSLRLAAPSLAAAGVIAYLVAGVFWPYLLIRPVLGLLESVSASSKYPWTGSVLFRGQHILGQDIPWTYLPVWFSVTAPPLLLAGLCAAIARADVVWAKGRSHRLAWGTVLLSIFFAPVYAIVRHATLYDGLRHFLFLMPTLAAVCGCGWTSVLEEVKWKKFRWAVAFGLVLLVAEPLAWYVRSHPYEYVYFSPLAGGLSKASRRYDTDYWGLSMREAAEWLDQNHDQIADDTVVVITNTGWHLLTPWFKDPSRFRKGTTPAEPFDVYLESYRSRPVGWDKAGQPVYSMSVVPGQVPFFRIHLRNTQKRVAAPSSTP